MPTIRQLDPHVADLIAAGEVVERPASVVKELLENAIDAGARKVTVEIAHGGMSLVRVTDDGCGIAADQVRTAFLRHATSKIATEFDLEAIGTLGFRGEALAAIASVARVEVLTRVADAALGASLTLEGGVVVEEEEAGCPAGTTMVVRDLFFNTPARLKFMKRDQAEGAAVFGVVQREALAHPEVSVRFLRDGRQEMLTPGDGQLKSAMYAVLGRDIALGFTPVKGSGEAMSVEGFASLPACCRGSRSYQHFFVNGRYVKSRTMQAAVEEAYKNQKMVGKFPGCVLHLTTRLNAVDVNVHPTKTEVKFTSEQQVFSTVYHAVLAALDADRSHPAAAIERPRAHDTVTPNQTAFRTMPAAEFRKGEGQTLTLHDPQPSPFSRRGAKAEPAFTPAPPVRRVMKPVGEPPKPKFVPAAQGVNITPPEEDFDEPESSTALSHPVEKSPAQTAQTAGEPAKTAVFSTKSEQAVEVSRPEAPPALAPAPELPPEEPEVPWVIRGELFHTYVVVEQGETALLIDKHAAHERMNFDRLKAAGWKPMLQQLLAPVTFTPAPEEKAVLLAHGSLLEEFGFSVEDFGGGALVVRQAPDDVDVGDIEDTLLTLAQRLLTTGTADPAGARDELLHTMACKAAIKGGWKSAQEELEVVARAVMSGQVKYCPHGRPVAIELTRKQLEKQFKRA